MADLVEDAVAANGGVAKLTPAQAAQAAQLGHDEWIDWLSGSQQIPYSVLISRVRRMMAVTEKPADPGRADEHPGSHANHCTQNHSRAARHRAGAPTATGDFPEGR